MTSQKFLFIGALIAITLLSVAMWFFLKRLLQDKVSENTTFLFLVSKIFPVVNLFLCVIGIFVLVSIDLNKSSSISLAKLIAIQLSLVILIIPIPRLIWELFKRRHLANLATPVSLVFIGIVLIVLLIVSYLAIKNVDWNAPSLLGK